MAVSLEDIERSAADWVIAMDRGLTSEERASIAQWRSADERHEAAFIRARTVWEAAIGSGQPSARRRTRPARASAAVSRRGFVLGGAMAASLAAGGLGLLLLDGRTYQTRREEVRRLAMEDGSQAVMNSATRMTVRFSDHRRGVELRQGEAWFQVETDPSRPFVVSTDLATVTAVGTAFTVREEDGATEVVVSEGTVRVRPAAGAPVVLSQGGVLRLETSKPAQVSNLEPRHVERRLAWRDGLIMLDGERLAEAAAEFNRYSRRPIRVAPEIADRRVVGVFNVLDAEGFARASAQLLAIPIEVGTDEIHIGAHESFTNSSQQKPPQEWRQ